MHAVGPPAPVVQTWSGAHSISNLPELGDWTSAVQPESVKSVAFTDTDSVAPGLAQVE